MLRDLPGGEEIKRQTDRLLREAAAYGRLPTPVDDLVAAAELREASEYVLSESAISRAPAQVRDLLRSAKSKIRGILDRKDLVVHVDPEVTNEGKRRFIKLHETTHQILPHQRDLVQLDTDATLSASVKSLFEQEANQGAAELLFQRGEFTRRARDYAPSVDAPLGLAQLFGSSFHAAFRRYVETHNVPVVGIVFRPEVVRLDPFTLSRYEIVCSASWAKHFATGWPRHMAATRFPFLAAFQIGEFEFPWPNRNGENVLLRVQAKHTSYRRFALVWKPRRKSLYIPPKNIRLTRN